MEKVKKAVILAAGFGTRVLPASKAIPKEMLNIVDKPAIQYIVEEVINSGITEILIVLSRGKQEVEDHFDRKPDLEAQLLAGGKTEFYKVVCDIAEMGKNITYVRQQMQNGTGGAVMYAKQFVGNDPFVVIYGDDVIIGDDPCTAQCCRAYEKYGKAVVSMKEVPFELVYLVMDPGYNELNRKKIESNAALLHIPITIFETDIFSVANNTEKNPCYLLSLIHI